MKTLLSATALIMSAGMACAQAAEKNDWHFNIGAMYEIENVEGQGDGARQETASASESTSSAAALIDAPVSRRI